MRLRGNQKKRQKVRYRQEGVEHTLLLLGLTRPPPLTQYLGLRKELYNKCRRTKRRREEVPYRRGGARGSGRAQPPFPQRGRSPWPKQRCDRSGSKGVLNERVAQASAIATRSQPPKPASLRDAGFAAPCGGAGMWRLPCPRVAL